MRCYPSLVVRSTLLSRAEEAGLVSNAVELSEQGFSVTTNVLKHHAMICAVNNHRDHKVTKKWEQTGVSRDWFRGFMSRWGHFISLRYAEGIDGGRRQLHKSQVLAMYTELQKLGGEIGENVREGERRLSSRQLCNLDETCIKMDAKDRKCIALKGAAKALRCSNKYVLLPENI